MPRGKPLKSEDCKAAQRKAVAETNKSMLLEKTDENGSPIYLKCKFCGKIKKVSNFYKCYSPKNETGYTYLCKNCCQKLSVNEDNIFDAEKLYKVLELIDKPFVNDVFRHINARDCSETAKVGYYIAFTIQPREDWRQKGFSHSETPDKGAISVDKSEDNDENKISKKDVELWGAGFDATEYIALNKKYSMIIDNYPLKTGMHKDRFLSYCKYAVKADEAVASGNLGDTKLWSDLADKVAKAGKLNPNQLSASDLNGGMSCFSQVAEMVEKNKEIIPLLPKYVDNPLDRVDYTLYMYFDYLMDLLGRPHIEYKDIYKYMFEQSKPNRKKFGKEVVPVEDKLAENAILTQEEKE